ncbi:hypothetical protein BTO06_00275 [Tenacibaculum sp. SZ-18]|uniref:C2H2-type zinc finger protein n=1 Tax=Tenacibaculum sp. SZ-18 TaxID=754423 RepID=UPI000C2D1C34|nr:C2H2-type zinc finger protein [Tenacibaculum sp. SZ-18]AUC13673.1 hypothetical protein BTO06_00275 [Tenacibaculum sp. SZ-18]
MQLENILTSLRLVTILVCCYIFGYAFKIGFLFYEVLEESITNPSARTITSFFSAIIISAGLLVASIHTKSKVMPVFLFLFDVIMMMIILHAFTNKGLELFKSVFISTLFALIGYLLISVFVTKYQQELAILKTNQAKHERLLAKQQQMVAHKCVCGKGFPSKQALSGHQRSCKIYQQLKDQNNS